MCVYLYGRGSSSICDTTGLKEPKSKNVTRSWWVTDRVEIQIIVKNCCECHSNSAHPALSAPPRRVSSSLLYLSPFEPFCGAGFGTNAVTCSCSENPSADIFPSCPHFWNAFTQLALWIWRALCRPRPQRTCLSRDLRSKLCAYISRESKRKKERKNPPPSQPSSTTQQNYMRFPARQFDRCRQAEVYGGQRHFGLKTERKKRGTVVVSYITEWYVSLSLSVCLFFLSRPHAPLTQTC